MNKGEYLQRVETELLFIMSDGGRLKNFAKQLYAKKIIGDEFEKNYTEDYLWRYALYLSSTGAFLLEESHNNEIGIESCRFAAELYENLFYVSEEYDKKYSLILSSLCYDIAGYQANAQCLIDELENKMSYYSLNKLNEYDFLVFYENKLLKTVQLFLQKKIFTLLGEINNFEIENSEEYLSYRYQKAFKSYKQAMQILCTFILNGEYGNYMEYLKKSHMEIMDTGNVLLSHILSLFRTRLNLFTYRNIWDTFKNQEKLPNAMWNNYLKLLSRDIYNVNGIKNENERKSIFEFWQSQLKALNSNILLNNENYVVQMPTSAGKTLIAEIMIVNSLVENTNSKCIYIAPFKALTSEIEGILSNRLSKLGFVVSSYAGSYEIDEFQQIWINNADILIATPEKIDLLYRTNKEFFKDVSLVIIDEGHLIGEKNGRASLLEFLIIKLRRMLETKSRFLFISAVMPEINAQEYSMWLSSNKNNLINSPKNINGKPWEPTRKLIGMFQWQDYSDYGEVIYPYEELGKDKFAFLPYIAKINEYKYQGGRPPKFPHRGEKKEVAVELAYEFIDEGPVLIFSSQPNWAESIGDSFIKLFDLKEKARKNIKPIFKTRENLESIEMAEKWFGEEHVITKCLKRGIGIHHGSLPDPIKKSIENDFREKNLFVLISTNTIGQGVNFPIKTIIIHSLYIGEQEKLKIKDFWNILGRAGRAGKETEGQIIFIRLTENDENLFFEYTNEHNIEPSNSCLLVILEKLVDSRLSELSKLNDDLIEYIEPYMLDILVEESVDTFDEEIIEEIMGYSLFDIQSKNKYLNRFIANGLKNIGKSFYELEDDILRSIYAKTGFHISSCNYILNFIEENIDYFRDIVIDEDYETLLEEIIDILLEVPEMNVKNGKKLEKNILENNKDILTKFIIEWTKGTPTIILKEIWDYHFSEIKKLKDEMYPYINNFLEYRYPWGSTVFLLILIYSLNKHFYEMPKELEELPENIKNLPSFIKYGLNNNSACIAKSIGVNTRETSLKLANLFTGDNFQEFIEWFCNLNEEDILTSELFSQFEIKNILHLIQKLTIGKFDIENIECYVKGIPYERTRRELSTKINVGDILTLERDFKNIYDVYAIKLLFKNQELGFIPRDIAKKLSIEMDLNDQKFQAKIIEKIEDDGYYSFKLKVI